LNHRAAVAWLVVMSIVFYGWWNAVFVILLIASIAGNYIAGLLLQKFEEKPRLQMTILVAAICGNISLLFYYKYVNFLIRILERIGIHQEIVAGDILLPLGISFFTFTQIGYLIDCKSGIAKGRRLLDYCLFVTFFPHLIAGPILHHREMMPQFESLETYKFKLENLAVGLGIFIAGLAKKVLIADQMAPISNLGFQYSWDLGLIPAWTAAFAYTMQLYFDFSGYTEMAIGQARMFGIRFPTNFNSPYKARSIIDFWQRWHMTLTRYLTLYLYNPVSLWITRRRAAKGKPIAVQGASKLEGFISLVAFPTMFTMGIAGVWHGAGVNYVIYGVLHGIYLTINHAWRLFGPGKKNKKKKAGSEERWLHVAASVALTYLAVTVSLVFFRAPREDGFGMLAGMLGFRGLGLGNMNPADTWTIDRVHEYLMSPGTAAMLFGCFLIVFMAPNVAEIFARYDPIIGRVKTTLSVQRQWRPNMAWGAVAGVLAGFCVLFLAGATEFLYFQF
jgi:D-alanyl-lipoteichoic acid acyltransferase DltB (MBOAT superfamily)